MGDNCIVGHDAVLFCHAVEGRSLALAPIVLGNNVTIGAKAVVMPGVTIGDDAVVAVGSVVAKGTRIGDGELWGGTPARKLRDIPAPTPTPSLA
jgi:acetyltransferase-like isoleucine patch superfamily enzyme